MFVKVENGYLKDPTFMGDGWYIRCSEDEGLMLVIRSRAKTVKSVKARMRKLMRYSGVNCSLVGLGYASTTAFPPDFTGLHASWKWEIKLRGSMPNFPVFPRVFVSYITEDYYGSN